MSDSNDQRQAQAAGMPGPVRAAHIREWLDERKRRRKAFSRDEAVRIASRLDRAIDELKAGVSGHAISRNRLALDAFGEGPRDIDDERARRKLQRHVWKEKEEPSRGAREARREPLTRAADGYARLVRTLNRHYDRDPDDDRLFIEIFRETSADPLATGRPIEGEFAARLEGRVQALADRLAARLQLSHYYRDVARFGVLRDLGHPQVRFRRDMGHNPSADIVEAGIPHVNPAWFEEGAYVGGPPHILAGRLPSVVLYRLRAAGPRPVEVVVQQQHAANGTVLDGIETRRGRVSLWFEIAIGAGPSDEWASGTRLFFETVPCRVIELLPDERSETRSGQDPSETLWPVERHDEEALVNTPIRAYRGDRIVDVRLLAPETAGDVEAITRALDKECLENRWSLDPPGAFYEPVTAESWYRFLVTLPGEAEEAEDEAGAAIVYSAARPGGQTMGVSPPGTLGGALEDELMRGAPEGGGIETKLQAKGEQLWAALDELRRESLSPDSETAYTQGDTTHAEAAERADEQLPLDMREWRQNLHLSQREAADWLGVTERTVNEYERGTKALPHRMRLAMLFCLLHKDEARALAQRRHGHDKGGA